MDKWRRGLKELALSVLTMGSSVLIAACYGAQYAGERMLSLVTGTVRFQATGVEGIEVCATVDTSASRYCATTDADGQYEVMVDEYFETDAYEQGCKLEVRDVDGAANGDYAPQDVAIPAETVPTVADVDLVPSPG
jgi:hypothetical protein